VEEEEEEEEEDDDDDDDDHHHHHHQGLGLMACSDSEFNFPKFMNLWTLGRTP
jgi:hypothetical protein